MGITSSEALPSVFEGFDKVANSAEKAGQFVEKKKKFISLMLKKANQSNIGTRYLEYTGKGGNADSYK